MLPRTNQHEDTTADNVQFCPLSLQTFTSCDLDPSLLLWGRPLHFHETSPRFPSSSAMQLSSVLVISLYKSFLAVGSPCRCHKSFLELNDGMQLVELESRYGDESSTLVLQSTVEQVSCTLKV
ncbi:hypothetical protein SLE2022_339110 [Rubroshorea leprosula]